MNKRGSKLFKTIKKHWRRISLKDKCLIILMIILLWQSGYNLFIGDGISTHSGSIDVVIRTTSAAIFGYFLSANFLNKKIPQITVRNKEEILKETTCTCTTVEKIPESKELKEKTSKEEIEKMQEDSTYFKAQILIAALIGGISLIILIVARDIPEAPVSSVSALAQFRDFVSGCVGFLIGVPEIKNNNDKN